MSRWLCGLALVALACQRSAPSPQATVSTAASSSPSRPSALARCRGPAGGDEQLRELVARCAGLVAGPELQSMVAPAPRSIVRIWDASAQTSALAWLESEGANTRVVALEVTSPDTSVAAAVRLEQLQGQVVAVEKLRTACESERLHWPQRAATAGLAGFPPRAAPDCPTLIERVWRRRGESLEALGAYAIAGSQRLSDELRREFSSTVAFGPSGIVVTDRADWLWLGAEARNQLWEDSYRPVTKRASSTFERRYQLEHDALTDRSDIEPIPKGVARTGEKAPAAPEMRVPCAAP